MLLMIVAAYTPANIRAGEVGTLTSSNHQGAVKWRSLLLSHPFSPLLPAFRIQLTRTNDRRCLLCYLNQTP